MGIKERNSTMLLYISKQHLIEYLEITRQALRKVDVEKSASTVMVMYKGAQTVIRTPEVTLG